MKILPSLPSKNKALTSVQASVAATVILETRPEFDCSLWLYFSTFHVF